MFIHESLNHPCYVHVHVDDLSIFGKDINWFKDAICSKFDMEDLGDAKFILGMRVTRDRMKGTLSLCQDQEIKVLLASYDMLDCKPANTPMQMNTQLLPATEDEVTAFSQLNVHYRRAVGRLNYITQAT